jgi:serine phosphatase RsbU (regulator of sigma subunit)/ligand-binding sensor domain-containing protein
MKSIYLIMLLLFLSLKLGAQINRHGVPAIINYDTKTTKAYDYNWSIVEDKNHVLYFASETKGIIRYDGNKWSAIPARKDALVRSLYAASDGVIYVGCAEEFGFLQPDHRGTMQYTSISSRFETSVNDTSEKVEKGKGKNISIGQVYSITGRDSKIYFQSQDALFIYDFTNDSISTINLRQSGLYQVVRIVNVNGRIIIADNLQGLFEIRNGKVEKLPGGDAFKMKRCLVIMPDTGNNIFIGTLENGVFLLDPETGKVTASVLEPSLNDRLKSAQLYTAIDLHSGERLLGTIQAGIFVIDRNHKLVGKWDTETTDMADESIMSLYIGDSPTSELWFANNGNISKAYVGLPYTELSSRTGLDGGLNSICEFNGSVFVSSDFGLFESSVNNAGERYFRKVTKGNINGEVYQLATATVGKEKFLLAASKIGLYQIFASGKVVKVDNVIKYPPGVTRTTFQLRSVLQSDKDPKRFYLGQEGKEVVIAEYSRNEWKYLSHIKSQLKGNVSSLLEDENGDLFIFTAIPTGIYKVAGQDTVPKQFSVQDGLPENNINGIAKIGGKIYISTLNGIFRYNSDSHLWLSDNSILKDYSKDIECRDLIMDNNGGFWLTTKENRITETYLKSDSAGMKVYKGQLNLLPDVDKGDFKSIDDLFWMVKSKSIFVIDENKLTRQQPEISTLLTRILIGGDSLMMNGSFFTVLPDGKNVVSQDNKAKGVPQISFNYNSVSFSWTLPYFIDEAGTLFSYKLEGFDKSWSKWEKLYYKDYTYLPFGKYTFRVKARSSTGLESREAVFEFNILKPWYLSPLMIVVYIIAIVGLIIIIIKAYTRKLKNENIRLEGIVAERTAVVVKQKDELESSIHYASRIQMALLPSESILSQTLKNYFILFKPRDIVSGDFYWMTKKENRLYIVAGDCTGHGVPGAFMSLLGMSFLDEIITKDKAPRADQVLSELRTHVTESLKQSGSDDEAKDGMDMSLLVIDFSVSRIEFSGAYNPCFKVRSLTEEEMKNHENDSLEMADGSMSNGKYMLETIYASKMPIGISSRMDENYVFYNWALEKGVSYYLFSDGYIDQFGGEHGRKFMKKNFKRLLLDIQDYPMSRQKELLDQNLKNWMGQSPQIDDILVMGLRTS